MQTPIYSPEDEQALMARLWSPTLKNDPLAWVMFCYPWGKQGTPLANFAGPRRWQRDALNRIRLHIQKNHEKERETTLEEVLYDVMRDATVSGRGPGKSALVAWIIHWFVSSRIGSTTI